MRLATLPHVDVLTRLGRSSIHGVGVFALVAIPEGTLVFPNDLNEIRWIDADEVDRAQLDPALQALYRDFAIRRDGRLGCLASFDLLTPGWYANRPIAGTEANLRATADFDLVAARDIADGEELTVDYDAMNQGRDWS